MAKIIFWLVVIFAALLVLRLVNVANSRARKRNAQGPRAGAKDGAMIRCVSCGVYLPSAEALPGPHGPLCGDPQCARGRSDEKG